MPFLLYILHLNEAQQTRFHLQGWSFGNDIESDGNISLLRPCCLIPRCVSMCPYAPYSAYSMSCSQCVQYVCVSSLSAPLSAQACVCCWTVDSRFVLRGLENAPASPLHSVFDATLPSLIKAAVWNQTGCLKMSSCFCPGSLEQKVMRENWLCPRGSYMLSTFIFHYLALWSVSLSVRVCVCVQCAVWLWRTAWSAGRDKETEETSPPLPIIIRLRTSCSTLWHPARYDVICIVALCY